MEKTIRQDTNISNSNCLVFGPGGVRGQYYIGVLHKMEVEGMLKNITIYSGVSVSSIIFSLYISGYSPMNISGIAQELDILHGLFSKNIKDKTIEIKEEFGIISNSQIRSILRCKFEEKFGHVPTFKELYLKTGKEFHISTYNQTKNRKEIFSPRTTPNCDILSAILLSINIPFIFYKAEYMRNIYIDGGIIDPLPFSHLDDGKNKITCVYIDDIIDTEPDGDVINYVNGILTCGIKKQQRTTITLSTCNCKFLRIECRKVNPIGIGVDEKSICQMIIDGSEAYEQFMLNFCSYSVEIYKHTNLSDYDECEEKNQKRIFTFKAKKD